MTQAEKNRARARAQQQRQRQIAAGGARSVQREPARKAPKKQTQREKASKQQQAQKSAEAQRKQKRREKKREQKRRAMTPEKLAKQQERKRKNAQMRQTLYHWGQRVAMVLVVLGAAILALTLFFRVERVEMTGTTRYSRADIVSQIDINEGDNLYLWDKITVRDTILTEFPYVKKVDIRRQLPNRIIITVTEATPVLAVKGGDGYYLVDVDGKILEYTKDPKQLMIISGVSLSGQTPGESLPKTNDDMALQTLSEILEMFQEMETPPDMEKINFINLESSDNVHIGYDGRFDIRLGAYADESTFVSRIMFALRVIENKLSPSDVGALHWDKKDRLHFVPGTLESVQAAASREMKAQLDAQEDPVNSDPADDDGQNTYEEDNDTLDNLDEGYVDNDNVAQDNESDAEDDG